MKTFWLNFPFNNCNKSGGRWNVPSGRLHSTHPPPPTNPPHSHYYRCFCTDSVSLCNTTNSQLTCGIHRTQRRKTASQFDLSTCTVTFAPAGRSTACLCDSTDHMTFRCCDVESSCQFGVFYLCTNPNVGEEKRRAELCSHFIIVHFPLIYRWRWQNKRHNYIQVNY